MPSKSECVNETKRCDYGFVCTKLSMCGYVAVCLDDDSEMFDHYFRISGVVVMFVGVFVCY